MGFADPFGCVPHAWRRQQRSRLRGAAATARQAAGRSDFLIIEKVGLARQEVKSAGAAGAVVATGRQQPAVRRAVGAQTERPQRAGGKPCLAYSRILRNGKR